jgi:hypothetical protein
MLLLVRLSAWVLAGDWLLVEAVCLDGQAGYEAFSLDA